MRIRRNHWLAGMLAAAIPVFAAAEASAQTTTPTATADEPTTGSSSPAAAVYALEPGDQLTYSTKGSVKMSGGGQEQAEDMDILTSITVLEKSGETLTLYAALSASEDTTVGKTMSPGPRFTFQMPTSGATGDTEFEKAGLAGAAFPTFSVENIFAAPPAEGKSTVTVSLPITNAAADGEAVTTKQGSNIETVVTVLQEGTPVLGKTTVFSTDKKHTASIDTSVSLSLSSQGNAVSFSITDKTELTESKTLPADQLAALKADVETAIPVANELRKLNMSQPDAIKSALAGTTKYLEAHPNGEFSYLFNSLQERLTAVAERTANWEKIKEGAEAPDFTAKTIDNKTVKLSDLKGKVVLLDFWATWCGPCLMELPNVKKLYAAYKDKGFEIIGISADETVEDLSKLVEQEDLQWPQIFDGGDKADSIQEQYGVMKYPTTILLDKEGKISAIDVRGEEMEAAVKKLIEGAEQ